MIIYVAGPLFSIAEREFNQKLFETIIENLAKAIVLLPQNDIEGAAKDDTRFQRLFDGCIGEIDRSDVVIAILDGPDVDSGTSFEIGYSFAKGKPIIGIRTDPRQLEESGVNLMISRSVTEMITAEDMEMTFEAMASKVIESLARIEARLQ